jgi:hypothetical protein
LRRGRACIERAERDEAEELFGDYQDLVETGTEILADLRDNFASSLDDETAEVRAEFNRAVAKRLPASRSRSRTARSRRRTLRRSRRGTWPISVQSAVRRP